MRQSVFPLVAFAFIGTVILQSCATLQAVGVSQQQIYAAENFYVLATDAATLYAKACNGGIIAQSCHANIDTIDAALDRAHAAYAQIRGYEQNPPSGAVSTFIAAVTLVQATIPSSYVRQVK